ncbi:Zn finger protein [Dimargaris cristalligena]|uniref:FYVE-type domain-containing protein n=1 Tax=Dimargaris cristalligena TaxID=215637 RepID=A0A4P9ZVE3_9FUNG|nr:Zn finger protein [Dimargaris cristalligena]RKP37557.1 hypothetical protein BJ085DRAFT_31876 [Dimargaris cristalligena]|eukprot:RKP37557.1 hypothetical protein BJ085DRAFT_31876 [Dimargaris cristalligena]
MLPRQDSRPKLLSKTSLDLRGSVVYPNASATPSLRSSASGSSSGSSRLQCPPLADRQDRPPHHHHHNHNHSQNPHQQQQPRRRYHRVSDPPLPGSGTYDRTGVPGAQWFRPRVTGSYKVGTSKYIPPHRHTASAGSDEGRPSSSSTANNNVAGLAIDLAATSDAASTYSAHSGHFQQQQQPPHSAPLTQSTPSAMYAADYRPGQYSLYLDLDPPLPKVKPVTRPVPLSERMSLYIWGDDLPRKHWKSDAESTRCNYHMCGRKFNFFFRHHHCRSCGSSFCGDCSKYTIYLKPDLKFDAIHGTPVRSCRSCYRRFLEECT